MTEKVETNPIADMIDHINNAEFERASAIWDEAIGERMTDAIEQEKVAVAQAMYSPEDESYEDEDLDVSDEELEAAADELEAEEE
jgi:hypothetical protein